MATKELERAQKKERVAAHTIRARARRISQHVSKVAVRETGQLTQNGIGVP